MLSRCGNSSQYPYFAIPTVVNYRKIVFFGAKTGKLLNIKVMNSL